MGMTIDDYIKELLINKKDDTYVLGNETIDFAIETMRKYQKIEQIVNDRYGKPVFKTLDEVIKVIEDGKID